MAVEVYNCECDRDVDGCSCVVVVVVVFEHWVKRDKRRMSYDSVKKTLSCIHVVKMPNHKPFTKSPV